MTLARLHYLGFSPVFAPLDLRSHRRGCRFQLGYTPIAIWHKSELRTAAWEAYGIGWVCMVACPGSSSAVNRGRTAVEQQLVLGCRTSRRGSCLWRGKWILVAVAVILGCGAGVPFAIVGLVVGDGSPDDGGSGPGSTRTTKPGSTTADGEPAAEGSDHEL